RAYADPKVDFIRTHIPLTGDILDLACGNGIFTQRLACEGGTVTGLDFSAHLLKQNPHDRLTRGDATHLPFMDSTFDVVFEANLLHHVGNVPGVMREMRCVSKKYVVLLEPNRYNPLMFASSPPKNKPPVGRRFQKGQSGNPKGRPPKHECLTS